MPTMGAAAEMKEDINHGAQIKGNGITLSARCAPDAENRSVDMRTLSGLRFVIAAARFFSQRQSLPTNPVTRGSIT